MKTPVQLLFAFLFLLSLQSYSQYRDTGDNYNRLGFQGGMTYASILTDNFTYDPQPGYMGGLTTRANTYKKLIVIYGVNFFQFNSSMPVLEPTNNQPTEIDFKATGVQLNLFMGHKLLGEHLSIEAGPVLQFNGKWSPEAGKEDYKLREYDILASDIEDVSKINLNVAGNISAGFPGLKIWAQYQYGLTNMYRNLDLADLKNKDPRITTLKGNLGMAMAEIVVYL